MLRFILQYRQGILRLATEWYCPKCGAHLGTTQGGEGRAEVVCGECSKK